jgi:steroid 5-alpha reductase family enzyme
MIPVWWHLLLVAAVMSPVMIVLWEIQRRRADASLVDAGWSAGIGCGAVVVLALGSGDATRCLVVGALVGLWSLRLTAHLVRDRLIGKPEDGRYRMLREKWGQQAQFWFFIFFQFQAVLVVFFVLPFVVIAATPEPFGAWYDWLGVIVWLLAITGEAIADRQLAQWRADPNNHGRTCRRGLWRYSRHPNYFCEWLVWFAYVALAAGGGWWPLTLVVPLILLLLLLFVTGIPYTEKRALASRGEDYRAYQRATSPFFPWFPRSETLS